MGTIVRSVGAVGAAGSFLKAVWAWNAVAWQCVCGSASKTARRSWCVQRMKGVPSVGVGQDVRGMQVVRP